MFGEASNNQNALKHVQGLSEGRVSEVHFAYAHTAANLDNISHTVNAHEVDLGIEARWTPTSAEYQNTLVEMQLQDYRHALDHLEYLVVQRMFELSVTNWHFSRSFHFNFIALTLVAIVQKSWSNTNLHSLIIHSAF